MSRQDRPDDPSTEAVTPPTRGPDDSSPTFLPADLPPHPDSVAIPGYEIFGQLGQGGMGTVYRARHRALDRIVALKILGDGIRADPTRFRTEVEAIARLQHPNIVQIFEVGVWGGSDGRPSLPYFTMEFCAGGSLDHRLAGTPLPGRDAASLVEVLARAMQAAHDARIIHRDLKPANILLQQSLNHPDTETQREQEKKKEEHSSSSPTSLLCASVSGWFHSYSPKISDFGLAKKLDEVGQTQTGAVMGTPSYMAPEQARGNKDVGPGVDVYALGAILYECVTGRPPFKAATTFDTLQQVVADEPAPPRRLNPKVDRDLETICLKCLEKDPRLRLPSAGVLADELRRYLDGKPILSRPIGVIGRFWRWGKRNPVVAGAGGLAVLALLGMLLVSIVFALRERRHSNELRQALFTARRQVAENHLDRALVSSAQTEPDERLLWLARSLQAAPDEAANLQRVIRLNLSAWSRALHELRAPLPHEAVVRCLAFSSDGKLLLTGCENGAVQIWDTHRCAPAGPPRTVGSAVLAVAFDEQGRALAAVRGEDNVRIVDARLGKTLAGPFAHEDRVVAAGWSGDGKLLATGSGDAKARVWDVSLNKARTDPLPHDHAVIAVALSPDGKQLLAGTLGRKAQLWDVGTGKPRGAALEHPQQVSAVAFVPGGERIVTGCGDNTVRMWDEKTGKPYGKPIRHRPADGTLWGLAVSGDGERLLSAGDDGTARVWRLSTAERVGQAMAHHDGVRAVAFSPDGRRFQLDRQHASDVRQGRQRVAVAGPHTDGRRRGKDYPLDRTHHGEDTGCYRSGALPRRAGLARAPRGERRKRTMNDPFYQEPPMRFLRILALAVLVTLPWTSPLGADTPARPKTAPGGSSRPKAAATRTSRPRTVRDSTWGAATHVVEGRVQLLRYINLKGKVDPNGPRFVLALAVKEVYKGEALDQSKLVYLQASRQGPRGLKYIPTAGASTIVYLQEMPLERTKEWELATHVLMGRVEKFEHADRKEMVISTEGPRFFLELTISRILKGKGLSAGDKVRLQGWRTGTQRQNHIPSAGRSRVTVFLKKKGTEYELLVPDGFRRATASGKKKS